MSNLYFSDQAADAAEHLLEHSTLRDSLAIVSAKRTDTGSLVVTVNDGIRPSSGERELLDLLGSLTTGQVYHRWASYLDPANVEAAVKAVTIAVGA